MEVSLSNGLDGLETLRNIKNSCGDKKIQLGAGTVITKEQVHQALDAGASYIITPGWDRELSEYICSLKVSILPGVYSPGEIMQAQSLGIKQVKLFPAHLSGVEFVKAMSGPFPTMQYVAVGGVSVHNAKDFLKNGFCALGIGSELVPRNTSVGCYDDIKKRADDFVKAVNA